jgi:hypothetical protein
MNLNPITIKKGIVFLVILGLALGFAFPALAGSLEKGNQNKEIVPKIDSEAAFIVREKNAEKEMDNAKFPEKFWIFLFGAYLFLLVFNLSFGLKDKKKIQWFWELLFTLLALWTWKKLDPNQTYGWFYYCVLESGVIIYFFYVYSLLVSKGKEY